MDGNDAKNKYNTFQKVNNSIHGMSGMLLQIYLHGLLNMNPLFL